ncbi:MAG: hypothetical protein V4464_09580, partial [Pseudomonadota bacterium]
DQLLNAELYAIAVKLNLPTDGDVLAQRCLAAAGNFVAADLPVKISAAWLRARALPTSSPSPRASARGTRRCRWC